MAIKGLIRIRGIRSPMPKGTLAARVSAGNGVPQPTKLGGGLVATLGSSGGGTITFSVGGFDTSGPAAVLGGTSTAIVGLHAQITLPTSPGPSGTLYNNAGVVTVSP